MSKLWQFTTERLATLLHEELLREGCGNVDPYWIQMVAEGGYTEEYDHHDQAEALGKVLDRVVTRIKEEVERSGLPEAEIVRAWLPGSFPKRRSQIPDPKAF